MSRRLLLVSAAFIVTLAALSPRVALADPGPTELRLSAPVAAAIGDVIAFEVTLRTASGEPVPGASVVLFEQLGFLGVSARDVPVASGVTGDDGSASLRYTARRDGVRALAARYAGDADHAASELRLELPVAPGPAIYSVESPAGIPGVNRFLLILVLSAVWGTMLVVALLVVAIARDGSDAEAPEQEVRP